MNAKGKGQLDTPAARARRAAAAAAGGDLRFTRRNYVALGGALGAIVLGYILLAGGSVTVAPVLLVLGYCVLIPYGLAAGARSSKAPAGAPGE